MKTGYQFLLPVLTSILLSGASWAADLEQLIFPIQKKWAEIKYETASKDQAELFKALALDTKKISETHPGSAEILIWEGIVISSEAGARSGFSASRSQKTPATNFSRPSRSMTSLSTVLLIQA